MALDWKELTSLTGGREFTVERVRMSEGAVAIEGAFELPPLARLTADDQAFVAAFVHCHGSIKQMERWFGVSYPTIKARLKRIAKALDFVEVDTRLSAVGREDALDRLARGEITVDEAVKAIRPGERGDRP